MSNTPSKKDVDDLVYALRQKGDDSTYALVVEAIAKWGTPQPARVPLKLVGTVENWAKDGNFWRTYQVKWHSDALVEGTRLFAEIPAHGITQIVARQE